MLNTLLGPTTRLVAGTASWNDFLAYLNEGSITLSLIHI